MPEWSIRSFSPTKPSFVWMEKLMSVFVSQSLCSIWWVTGLVLHDQGESGYLQSWTAECTGYRNQEAPHWLKWCNTISVHICVCVWTHHVLSRGPRPAPPLSVEHWGAGQGGSLLTSNKYFTSCITIKESSIPRLSSVARSIYRIFSHAYFHHKALYDQFEVSWSENDIIWLWYKAVVGS